MKYNTKTTRQKTGTWQIHIQRLRVSSVALSSIIKPPLVKSSWWVRFTTSSGSSIPANCTPGDFFSSSKCGTWYRRKQSHSFKFFFSQILLIIFYTNSFVTSQMCSAMSSFLRMMRRDEELSSPRKNWDGCTAVWPSASNCAFWK